MGRKRAGPAPADPPLTSEPLEVYTSILASQTAAQLQGSAYYGQSILDAATRVPRAPALYAHECDMLPSTLGRAGGLTNTACVGGGSRG